MAVIPNLVDTFMDNWANPSSEKARKLSQHPMMSFMRWLKRPTVKMEIDPKFVSPMSIYHPPVVVAATTNQNLPATPVPVVADTKYSVELPVAGIRSHNIWLCFDEKNLAKNAEEYESMIFVEKIQYGYYGWPMVFKVCLIVCNFKSTLKD